MSEVELEDIQPAARNGQLKYVKLQDLKPGETYKGIYLRKFKNEKSKYDQRTYVLFSSEHELLGLNGTYDLDGYFEVIEEGRYVAITYLGEKSYTGKDGKEKTQYECKVQCGKENQYTADLRALSTQADRKQKEEESKPAAPKSTGKLEGLFGKTPNTGIPL